jgi:hypothetical protein
MVRSRKFRIFALFATRRRFGDFMMRRKLMTWQRIRGSDRFIIIMIINSFYYAS